MENILKATSTLCILAYITGLVSNMVNINHTQKSIRLVCALYIISSLTFNKPSYNSDYNYFPEIENTTIKNDAVEFVISETENSMETSIKNELTSKNISYTDVVVHIHKQSDRLEIQDICIYGTNEYDKNDAINLLSIYTDNIIFGE